MGFGQRYFIFNNKVLNILKKNSMKENTSRGKREQLLHYPVYFNLLSVLRV